jgi:hypothetical protein
MSNRLVSYDSSEGELINQVLKNDDLTKLVESFLFNHAYMRVGLPSNVSQKTKEYCNEHTLMEYYDFISFHEFHSEKRSAKTTSSDPNVEKKTNILLNNLLSLLISQQCIISDHYIDHRFREPCLYMIFTRPVNESGTVRRMYVISNTFDKTKDVLDIVRNNNMQL